MDLNELIKIYDDANTGPIVLSAAVTLHNAFPELVSNVRRLVVAARQALEESPNGPIAIETSELLRVALEPFKSLKTGRKR